MPFTVNAAEVPPAAMNTLKGATVATPGALLERLTVTPPAGAAAASVTEPPTDRPTPTIGLPTAIDRPRSDTVTLAFADV